MEREVSRGKVVPKFVAPCLWSYDINQMDVEKDKALIITQVLNYGDPKRIKWLYSVYREEDITAVVMNPGRGLWFPKVLNFWETMLGIKIPPKKRKKALFNLHPDFTGD